MSNDGNTLVTPVAPAGSDTVNFGVAGEPRPDVSDFQRVVFQPDWMPNGQFAGFFVAQESGLFTAEGLAVEIRHFDFGTDFIGAVSRGEAQIGTVEAYILLDAVAKGADLVAVGALLKESPAGYLYLESSGVQEPADLAGKRVGVHVYAEELLPFFLTEAGLSTDAATPVLVEHDVSALLDGRVDLHQGYAIDELLRLQAMTVEPARILLFEELGLPMYSMVIYANRTFFETQPEAVAAFLRASAAGWEAALADPAKTAAVINGPYADDRVDDALMELQVATMAPFIRRDGRVAFSMTRQRWEAMQSAFLRSGMTDRPVDLDRLLPTLP